MKKKPSVLLVKRIICLILTKIERILGKKPQLVTILVYHSISQGKTVVDVSPENFAAQMVFLKSKFDFITLHRAVDYIQGKAVLTKPSVVITFDDGYADLFDWAVPLLAKEKIPATVFVLAQPTKANRKELRNKKTLLTFKQIEKLQKIGWTIGCHSLTHANFGSNIVNFQKEIIKAKKILEKKLKTKVEFFAYPKGLYNKKVINFIKFSKYRAAFKATAGKISTKTNLYEIPRLGIDRTHHITMFPFLFTRWAIIYFITRIFTRKLLDNMITIKFRRRKAH